MPFPIDKRKQFEYFSKWLEEKNKKYFFLFVIVSLDNSRFSIKTVVFICFFEGLFHTIMILKEYKTQTRNLNFYLYQTWPGLKDGIKHIWGWHQLSGHPRRCHFTSKSYQYFFSWTRTPILNWNPHLLDVGSYIQVLGQISLWYKVLLPFFTAIHYLFFENNKYRQEGMLAYY